MKMNKILLVVALLFSARAFAWHISTPTMPNFAKNGWSAVCNRTQALASQAKPYLNSAFANLRNAGSSVYQTVANHPKIAIAATAATVAVVAGLAILGKKASDKAKEVAVKLAL
jgi:hypothetical protein